MIEQAARDLRVLVTAGGSGIGLAVARCFLRQGHTVHICDINRDALDHALLQSSGLSGSLVDVGDPSSVDVMFESATEALGGLDVLINNAGIGGSRAPIEDLADEDWNETIRVNLNGVFYCTKRAVRIMKAQLHGCIVNLLSAPAAGLTYNVARELEPYNISCNVLLHGATDDNRGSMIGKQALDQGISINEGEPLRYLSLHAPYDAAEIGELCVFLATHGRHISGQEIGVCG